jgi:hypothetical protein
MTATAKPRPLTAILVGGLIAGVIDIGSAMVTFHGTFPQVMASIASGWVGKDVAKAGGANIIAIGLASHLGIACLCAAIYVFFARHVPQLLRHPVIGGLVFGLCVYGIMNALVVPLSARHGTPPMRLDLVIEGVAEHMILFGLPIAFAAQRFLGKPVEAEPALAGPRNTLH